MSAVQVDQQAAVIAWSPFLDVVEGFDRDVFHQMGPDQTVVLTTHR